jgi:hypothetical protein
VVCLLSILGIAERAAAQAKLEKAKREEEKKT